MIGKKRRMYLNWKNLKRQIKSLRRRVESLNYRKKIGTTYYSTEFGSIRRPPDRDEDVINGKGDSFM